MSVPGNLELHVIARGWWASGYGRSDIHADPTLWTEFGLPVGPAAHRVFDSACNTY